MFLMKMAVLFQSLWDVTVSVLGRILSAVIEQHARLFVNKTPKGQYRYAWGINFPKELAPYDVHLITVNTKDEEANALTERLELLLWLKAMMS